MNPPIAKRIPVESQIHGVETCDDYGWLRADNWQECVDDPSRLPADIKHYLDSENDWFESVMADTKDLQDSLVAEMKGRIQADDTSLPDHDGPWSYVERYQGDEEHPSYWRCPRMSYEVSLGDTTSPTDGSSRSMEDAHIDESELQLLIDFNIEATDHDYFDPGDVEYSPAHTHLAWSADTTGSERYTVFIRDLANGEDKDTICDVESAAWGNESYLFYTRVDDDHRPSQVFRHELGTETQSDVLVYEETDSRFFCSVWTSVSADFVFISSDMNDESEVWFIPVGDITSAPQIIEPRAEGIEYSVDHQGSRFLIRTNADEAADFKIMETSCETPSREHWQDWLPYQPGRMVLDHYAYKNWVMWMERENALPCICYRHNEEKQTHRIEFTEEAFALSLDPLVEFDEDTFQFEYESPATPSQTFKYHMPTAARQLLKEDHIPSGHDSEHYEVARRYAKSSDGEMVPLTILHHKNTPIDGSAPCWLSAYGAYGSSSPASFGTTRLSLVDRGFVYVIAHVRGGQEKGRAWYEAARFGGKPKSMDDLIAVGEYLVEEQYTKAGNIVIAGGSAGGLLVGAALNRICDLWGGAVADVPFVDVLNTMLDDTLPLTPGEWSQWGNPKEDVQAYLDIKSYSPYDNVQAREYPPMLVTAGVSDPRVTYWEPAKWVARHRHMRCDEQILLLKTNMSSGHFGETGRYASLVDVAIEQAFALKVLNLL
ncbi:MAG: oligopeptidase B [Granulosicoccus sp.]|jgi:oligopeptidase B